MIGGFSNGLAFAIVGMMVVSASIQSAPSPSSANGSVWEIETVVGDASLSSSMALDSNGLPHISYRSGRSLSLKHAKLTESGWVVEIVDSRKFGGGGFPSLVFDSSDRPHISYDLHPPGGGPYSDSDLRYAWWDGSGWNIQIVDTDGDVGSHSSIALTSTEYPHIAYRRSYHGMFGTDASELKYTRWNGSAWNIEIVEHTSGDIFLSDRSLAIGSDDLPHISYSGKIGDEYYLKYATWNGSDWEIEAIDSVGDYAAYTSLALDSNGRPHISYNDRSDGDLKYTRWNGSGWEIEVVDSDFDVGWENPLALDSEDRPHLAYIDQGGWDPPDNNLKYARKVCGTWRAETVDSSGIVQFQVSIAMNESDYPHIAYHHHIQEPFTPSDLMYAYRTVMDEPSCDVSLDIDPDTLNLKSRGRWITAYLSSENASVFDIDVPSILLQDTLTPERWDYQGDVLMIKFNRQALKAILGVGESVEIKLSGKWSDGTDFEVYDYIRVIGPGRWTEGPGFPGPNPSAPS